MRFTSRKSEPTRRTREDQWRQDRAAAPTLRNALPNVARIRIALHFEGAGPSPPAAQWHVMHPAARAFFAFPCPYGDCDGRFDLSAPVNLVTAHATSHATGALECTGVRSRDGTAKQPCGLVASYSLDAEYHTRTDLRACEPP